MTCPKLRAPACGLVPASSTVSIETRLSAICPCQNAGHDECRKGHESCIDNWDVVETTISATKTLIRPTTANTRRPASEARGQTTARPRHKNGKLAPA